MQVRQWSRKMKWGHTLGETPKAETPADETPKEETPADETPKEEMPKGETPGPILVAIDFSEDSEAAASWAVKQASALAAPLCFIHVVHEPVDQPGFYRENPNDIIRPMSEVAEEMLNKYVSSLIYNFPRVELLETAEIIVVRGLPPTRIVEAAEKLGASQIVMGCRGLTGMPRLMLGSQTERVVQLAHIPVTAVKAPDHNGDDEDA